MCIYVHFWLKIRVFSQILTSICLHGRYPESPKQANWPCGPIGQYPKRICHLVWSSPLSLTLILWSCTFRAFYCIEKMARILLSHGPIGISKEPERLEYVSRGPNRLLCLLVGSENTKWAESERVISPFTLSMPTHGYPISHELILHLEWYPTPLEQATY